MKKLGKLFCSLFSVVLLFVAQTAFGQSNMSVSGTVTDQSGAPVIGASIMLSGNTTVGALTDLDGKYTINVPSNATLIFSCIGYSTQNIAVSGRAKIA